MDEQKPDFLEEAKKILNAPEPDTTPKRQNKKFTLSLAGILSLWLFALKEHISPQVSPDLVFKIIGIGSIVIVCMYAILNVLQDFIFLKYGNKEK